MSYEIDISSEHSTLYSTLANLREQLIKAECRRTKQDIDSDYIKIYSKAISDFIRSFIKNLSELEKSL